RGDPAAGLIQGGGGRFAEAVVARGVAEAAGQVRPGRFEGLAAHRRGGRGVQVQHHRPAVTATSRPRSSTGALWVRAPEEITSTPVRAISTTVSRVMVPLASTRARSEERRVGKDY